MTLFYGGMTRGALRNEWSRPAEASAQPAAAR
jgi:hypothetical protein